MPVNIIQGAIGAGKSELCLDQIKQLHSRKPDARCIMIVPDHYSYDTEKRFVECFGGTGLNNIEVLTLRKMAINNLKASELKYITGAGRQMLIYKAVNEFCENAEKEGADLDARLIASMRKDGFLDVAGSLISEMKRYTITPEKLLSGADGDNETLRRKLTALSKIYADYADFVKESGCVDSEDDLDRLADFIAESGEFGADTYVWFDKFDEFMPHQVRVIEAMLKRGANVTLSVISPEPERKISRSLERAEALASEYGLNERYELTDSLNHVKNNPELYFLFKNWGNIKAVYKEKTRNITLFESRDAYGEIERAACRILDLVREEGFRFRDIAMLCGNTEEYRHLIETIFEEYSIPYFTDSTIALSDHPIAMQVLSLFDLFRGNWTHETVFKYLRAGFIYEKSGQTVTALSQDRIDELENFSAMYGIRGGTQWLSEEPWQNKNDIIDRAFGRGEDSANERIEALRLEIINPIRKFKEATSGRRPAVEFARALYAYFEDIYLYEGLKAEVEGLKKAGMLNEAEQFTKIWNLLLDVLNQTVVSVGDKKMNRRQYADYIRAGLSKCEIRIIPSGIDQVYVGDVERSSQSNVRAMFVIGANNGTFPSDIPSEGFLSNNDRNALEERGIHVAPDTRKKAERQYFKVYRALCAATEKLFLSYPLQTGDGKALRASRMLLDIHAMFPNLVIVDNLLEDMDNQIYISAPDATIHRMIVAKSGRNPNRVNPIWEAAYRWYAKKNEWTSMLALVDTADKFAGRDVSLDAETARALYKDIDVYNASRLNLFARCPYSHFVRYGLNPAVYDDKWDVSFSNTGRYAHDVIRAFVERVEDGAQTPKEKLEKWKNLAEDKTDDGTITRGDILNEIIEGTCENILASSSPDKEHTVSIFRRMGKTIAGAAGIIHRSLKNGMYTENGLETKFEIEFPSGIKMGGIIDRVDVYDPGNGEPARVRIIDYKTGSTSFDIVNLFNGMDLQLVIYAIAAQQAARGNFGGDAVVTGIYYSKIRDDFQLLNITDPDTKADKNHEKERRLDGVTFIEDDGSRRYIEEMDDISAAEKFLNIELNVNGGIKTPDAVKTQAEINGLMDFVGESVEKMDSAIKSGVIAPLPYHPRYGKSPCEFCLYKSICGFFRNKDDIRCQTGTKAEAWDEMAKRGGDE